MCIQKALPNKELQKSKLQGPAIADIMMTMQRLDKANIIFEIDWMVICNTLMFFLTHVIFICLFNWKLHDNWSLFESIALWSLADENMIKREFMKRVSPYGSSLGTVRDRQQYGTGKITVTPGSQGGNPDTSRNTHQYGTANIQSKVNLAQQGAGSKITGKQ